MRARAVIAALAAAASALSLAACEKSLEGVDVDVLDDALARVIGSPDTCVIIAEAASGDELYRYNSRGVCMRPLPPCQTFDLVTALTAVERGLAPDPEALRRSLGGGDQGVFQAWARQIGVPAYEARLKAFRYGQGGPAGPADAFWMGPVAGGALAISTRDQTEFLHRLVSGGLPVGQAAADQVLSAMAEETRGDVQVYSQSGGCASISDDSRNVGWWMGRLRSPTRDLVFVASMEGLNALPGLEMRVRGKRAFTEAGLLPRD